MYPDVAEAETANLQMVHGITTARQVRTFAWEYGFVCRSVGYLHPPSERHQF